MLAQSDGEAHKGEDHQNRGLSASCHIVTADTLEQAIERSGSKAGSQGTGAALAAIEMANLLRSLTEV